MTLGGLALAVGVLVDEGTVLLENIHVHLDAGENVARAVHHRQPRGGAAAAAGHAGVLAVFIPSFFMTGPAHSLFLPLSLAVGFAMLASYLLSSSLVPVLANWMLKPAARGASRASAARGRFCAVCASL